MNDKYKKIAEAYLQGESYLSLGKKFKVAPTTIQKALKENKIVARKKEKYKINRNYFKEVDSHEKAYFLGLILADGCVLFNRNKTKINKLVLSLQEEDGYLIEEFKRRIGFNGPVKTKIDKRPNRKNSTLINIFDEVFVSELTKFGIKPNKSVDHSFFVNIPDQFLPSAILGYFDGDGSVSFLKKENRLDCSIISSIEFSQHLHNYLISKGIKNNISIRKTKNGTSLGMIKIKGNKQGLAFFRFLYQNETPFLKRKKQKFELVIQSQALGLIKKTN
jgi:hypothetical protein